ncbi:DUF4340 domain-containing protein [Bdellovibrionota bacterium]
MKHYWKFFAIFIATLLLYYVHSDKLTKEEELAKQNSIAPLNLNEIMTLSINTPRGEILLKKMGVMGWVLLKPIGFHGKQSAVELLLNKLLNSDYLSKITVDEKEDYAKYNLTDPKIKITVETKDPSLKTFELDCGLISPTQQVAYCKRNIDTNEVIAIPLYVIGFFEPKPSRFIKPDWAFITMDWKQMIFKNRKNETIHLRRKGENFYFDSPQNTPVSYDKLLKFFRGFVGTRWLKFLPDKPQKSSIASLELKYTDSLSVNYQFFLDNGVFTVYDRTLNQAFTIEGDILPLLSKTSTYFINLRLIPGSEYEVKSFSVSTPVGRNTFNNKEGDWSSKDSSFNAQEIFQPLFYLGNLNIEKQSPLSETKPWDISVEIHTQDGSSNKLGFIKKDRGTIYALNNKQSYEIDTVQWDLLFEALNKLTPK